MAYVTPLDQMWHIINRYNSVVVYGAGSFAKRLVLYLLNRGVRVISCVVSEMDSNTTSVFGVPVFSFSEWKRKDDDSLIVLAVLRETYSLMDSLFKMDTKRVLILNRRHYNDLIEWERNEYFVSREVNGLKCRILPYSEKCMHTMVSTIDNKPIFRVLSLNVDNERYLDKCSIAQFEIEYGKYNPDDKLPELINATKSTQCCTIERYIITSHMDSMRIDQAPESFNIMLQVGASLTDVRKGCITDDTGDNISEKNGNYCECTGLYWIWKNTRGQDYVGIEHYRRRLRIRENQERNIRMGIVDILTALPQFVMQPVGRFFRNGLISETDWDLIKNSITTIDSRFSKAWEKFESCWFYFSCNLCLMKRNWFDEYCKFAFGIAFRIESEYENREIYRNDRYMGYIFEILFSVFVMRYYEKLHMVFTEVEWIETPKG